MILANVTVGEGATVNYSIVDSDTTIGAGCVIGRTKSSGDQITVIGSDLVLQPGKDIPGGAMVNKEWLEEHNL